MKSRYRRFFRPVQAILSDIRVPENVWGKKFIKAGKIFVKTQLKTVEVN